MLAEEIDFHRVFKINPTAMALLTADLVIVDVNDAFLNDVERSYEEVSGRNFFELFPKEPSDPGNPKWTVMEAAVASGQQECIKLSRYDVEDRATPGLFVERWWSATVVPIRGTDGKVEMLELSAREATAIIAEYHRKIEAEG
jgi:PAS domain-containing protein